MKKFFAFIFSLISLFLFKITYADNVFRVTEYEINYNFGSAAYNLNLRYPLAENHFILIKGAESGNVVKTPANSYIKISRLASSGNKSLQSTGTPTMLELSRYSSGNSSWTGVVTVVECLSDCETNGFKTLDVFDLNTPKYTNTSNKLQTGTKNISNNWSNIDQVTVFGGALGSGSYINDWSTNSGYFNSGWLRLYPSGNNTINWERYNSNNAGVLAEASHTVYVIEWGSNWKVQRTKITATNGGSGADNISEYTTASIEEVKRENTWVYGSGYSYAAAMNNGSTGAIVTLGDGVNKNEYENKVSLGSQVSGYSRVFDIYVMSHPDLSVDYVFKPNSGNRAKTTSITTKSASDGSRMSQVYSCTNSNDNSYPASIISSRYNSNTSITLQREYYPNGNNYAYTSWVQGIDFSKITYVPKPTLSQYKYRWRDDSRSLNEANGWISELAQDSNSISKNGNYRLRIVAVNTGDTVQQGRSFKLQYGLKINDSCSAITSWNDITSSSGGISLYNTNRFSDQERTSMLIDLNSDGYYSSTGYAIKTSTATNPVSIDNRRYAEFEFSLHLANDLDDGAYCFRMYNVTDDEPFKYYLYYPTITIGSKITQEYYRWYENNNSITPTNYLALENQECYIREGQDVRLRTNIKVEREAANNKEFILKYSKDNTENWKNVGNFTNIVWWNNNYSSRKKINFGNNHSTLPVGYTASFYINTREYRSDGNDIRIVFQYNNGTIKELDRIADNWNSENSKIEFKLISEISQNANYPADGNYYVYLDNKNATIAPSNLENIYFIYDDFNDGRIGTKWNIFDNDKVENTSFLEANGVLNINAGGIDTWKDNEVSVDDYATIYQNNISGNFEVLAKFISQEDVGISQNSGIMIKNDITKTQINNGYFINANNRNESYISSWDTNNDGYLDEIHATENSVIWPHCLKITKNGTIFSAFFSDDCVNYSLMNTQTIFDANSVQDVGLYVVSNANDVLSLAKIDYFRIIKTVTNKPTITLEDNEEKNNWEFLDNSNLGLSSRIYQLLLSRSNIGELYSEQNPISPNPGTINVNNYGEYDFPLSSRLAEKGTYYFKLARKRIDLDGYSNYATITIGNKLIQNNYRWYINSNSLSAGIPLASENFLAMVFNKAPVRLKINVKNSLSTLNANQSQFVLQYSKNLVGPWNNVGNGEEWNFYDNTSVLSNQLLENLSLSDSTTLESYSEQNPISNINPILNNNIGEYDFALSPVNVSSTTYYFRLVDIDGKELDEYKNYPEIKVNVDSDITLSAYRFYKNINSNNVGISLGELNTTTVIESNASYRLRILNEISRNNLAKDAGIFKLYFAEKGNGTCAQPEFDYEPVTKTSLISFNDNNAIEDNILLEENIDDPSIINATIKNQTYKEIGDFSNSETAINAGEYGKWDFSLKNNNAPAGKNYCFKIINLNGNRVFQDVYPEISISTGVLTINIVDNSGNIIENPIFILDSISSKIDSTSSQGIFGFDNQKIRISNSTNNPKWSVSLSAVNGPGALWTNGNGGYYDFNDPTPNAEDGDDEDDAGGQMSIDTSTTNIIPQAGNSSSGINLISNASFEENIQDSLNIISSSNTTETDTYWDIIGINVLQSIPALQEVGDYSIEMMLTIIAE